MVRETTRNAPEDPPSVLGYRIAERIHEGSRAVVYRGRRESDGLPVVVKLLREDLLTPENAASYQHEYQILRRLRSCGVVEAYDFVREPTAAALVVEDCGGRSLRKVMDEQGRELDTATKIDLALKLIAALRDVHAASIIHKDINPNNIIVDLENHSLKIIDFGLATPLQREQTTKTIPSELAGTVAYIAPEQTGRMNRALDYRSDFYSLGVTLYELFTGQLPFSGRDPLELIHSHIARQPIAPHELNPRVPEPISSIILKLLAKTAEDRYQSLWSLEADFERCRKEWSEGGEIRPFAIDQSSLRDRFQLPQKLYGRDAELAALLEAFEDVRCGRPRALLVTGASGIGKTRLVREVYKPITASRGYFASGKFDRFQWNIPYSAVLAALRELVCQLLSENEQRLQHWRRSLQEAVGANGRLLTDLLPELEHLIGEQPAIAALGPTERHDKLTGVMIDLLSRIGRPDHPLVIHLDDLQWADGASLALLRRLLTHRGVRSFLLIASYRDDEVRAGHPAVAARDEWERDGAAVDEIALGPLSVEHISQLVADAFAARSEDAAALAALVHAKTSGNPFFIEVFLTSLWEEKRLVFDGPAGGWLWRLESIRGADATDNVIDFMTRSVRRLNPGTQELLRIAACIGSSFEARTLAIVAERSVEDTMRTLNDAILSGFVLPLDEAYRWANIHREDDVRDVRFRFAHDRVQQAAYGLVSPSDRGKLHYRVGSLLHMKLDASELERRLFEVVNQLNLGREHAVSDEREGLARLNLDAGRRAVATAVYDVALDYFKTGIELLGERGWEDHYDLARALHCEAGQVAPLSESYDELDALLDVVRANARTALDMMPVFESKIVAENCRVNPVGAARAGLEALRLLGSPLPGKPNAFHRFCYRTRAKLALAGKSPEELRGWPRMTDPVRIAESRILRRLCPLFYWSSRDHLALALYRLLYLGVRFGHSEASPFTYACHAMTLCTIGQVDKGYRFGRLASGLVDDLGARRERPYVGNMVHCEIAHWKVHCRESLPSLLEDYRQALEIGDMESAGVTLLKHGCLAFHAGELLGPLHRICESHVEALSTLVKDRNRRRALEIHRDLVAFLIDRERSDECGAPRRLSAEEERREEKKHFYIFHFSRAFLALHFGDDESAFHHVKRMLRYTYTVTSLLRFGDLYEGLVRIRVHRSLPGAEQKRNHKAVLRARDRLRRFSGNCPDNYRHRWQLLEAELARLDGRGEAAQRHYDEAIAAARRSGHLHEEALGNECAARYYLGEKRVKVAKAYFDEARQLYGRWGAARKVRWLDETYPQFASAPSGPRVAVRDVNPASSSGSIKSMDLSALMKALKAIAEENVHSRILQKTVDIVMQFSGAEKVLLLLRNGEGDLCVEADMDTSRAEAELLRSIPAEESVRLCQAVVNFVRRTKTSVVIHDAQEPQSAIPGLHNDRYIASEHVRSILCIPVAVGQGRSAELIGILYVENNQLPYAFADRRVSTLEIICLSVAGRLELSRKAVTDSLTGLYNHEYFQSALRQEASLARRTQRPLSLLMIDIDHFKQVNDEWGHQMGDAVLRDVARVIEGSCRESDVVARYGGEEVAVILPETGGEQAVKVANRIRRALREEPYRYSPHSVRVTASIGVVTSSAEVGAPELLIWAADEALYRAKAEGRDRVCVA